MKRLILSILVIGVLLLSACAPSTTAPSSDTNQQTQTPATPPTEKGESTEEFLVRLKREAVKADFVQLNSYSESNIGKLVYAEGEITIMREGLLGNFILSQREGDGYGIYDVNNVDFKEPNLSDGDTVRVWGMFMGKEGLGELPRIEGFIIERR